MMRSNMHGFNTPSREAIYKRVMKVAYGSEWKYDYEEFVEFDLKHQPKPRSTASRSTETNKLLPLPAPKFVNRPLQIEKY